MSDTLGERQVLLWPNGAPEAVGNGKLDQPALTIHLPREDLATGCGVIVNPGGGYRILASDHEGLQVAKALNRVGIAAFVLRYRVGPTYHTDVSLLDGLRAVRYVRHHCAVFGVQRVGMLGFSAGGHLTVAVGTQGDDGDPSASDPIDRQSSQLDFLAPIYAVTNGLKLGHRADEYTPADTRVNATTPPTFLVHTHEDDIVSPEQSVLFYEALRRAGVQAELHIFGYGEHGVGLAPGDPDVAHWFDALRRWLRRSGFLTHHERCSVRGTLTVRGEPLGIAWVTLIPEDDTAPTARVKFNRSTEGQFIVDTAHGPVPGPHKVVIHYISDQYPHTADGAYTLADAKWFETSVEIARDQPLALEFDGG